MNGTKGRLYAQALTALSNVVEWRNKERQRQNMRQFVPLSVGYLASYAYSIFGDKVEIKLFKSADKLLDAIEDRKPDLLGLSNYYQKS